MISVPLDSLLLIPDAYSLCPEEFRMLMVEVERDPNDRVRYGVVADWCEERDEYGLAVAFRWLEKRPEVEVRKSDNGRYWMMMSHTMPPAFREHVPESPDGSAKTGLAYRVAMLAGQISKLKSQL